MTGTTRNRAGFGCGLIESSRNNKPIPGANIVPTPKMMEKRKKILLFIITFLFLLLNGLKSGRGSAVESELGQDFDQIDHTYHS